MKYLPSEFGILNPSGEFNDDEWHTLYILDTMPRLQKRNTLKIERSMLEYRIGDEKEPNYSARESWWKNLPERDKESIVTLPYFDYKIFYACTGIDTSSIG